MRHRLGAAGLGALALVLYLAWSSEKGSKHTVTGARRRKRVSGLWPDDPKAMQDAPASAAEGDDLFPPAGFDYDTNEYTYGQGYGYESPNKGDDDVSGFSDRSNTFGPYTDATMQSFLSKVRGYGMTVTGSNPWHIDANQHGITLDATADASGNVTVSIKTKNFYVANTKVWEKVSPLMPRPDR